MCGVWFQNKNDSSLGCSPKAYRSSSSLQKLVRYRFDLFGVFFFSLEMKLFSIQTKYIVHFVFLFLNYKINERNRCVKQLLFFLFK